MFGRQGLIQFLGFWANEKSIYSTVANKGCHDMRFFKIMKQKESGIDTKQVELHARILPANSLIVSQDDE